MRDPRAADLVAGDGRAVQQPHAGPAQRAAAAAPAGAAGRDLPHH